MFAVVRFWNFVMMNVEESSLQLYRKLDTLSSDLESFFSKAFEKSCKRVRTLIPDFHPPRNMDTEPTKPRAKKRKTVSSKKKSRSAASPTRSKRRKCAPEAASECAGSVQVCQ